MALLTMMIFFSITGITLNHPEWFEHNQATIIEADFVITAALLPAQAQGQLLSYLYKSNQLNGNRLTIERGDEELFITDKGPGTHLSLTIDLTTGEAFKEATDYGNWALLNDLHKGRNSGSFWSFVIDLSAIMMIFFSVTGFILALAQRRINRTMGLSILSSLMVIAGYLIWV